jgi:uncharacterized Zn finger protein (UPF0148 family)
VLHEERTVSVFVHGSLDRTMATPLALTCPWCGAPLPIVVPGQVFATCAYCGSTASLAGTRAVKAQPHQGPIAPAIPTTDASLQQCVIETFKTARQRGASPFDSLAAAARERLGPLGRTDAFARVCFALAHDFDVENRTKTVDDPMCMGRMIEVYLKAIEAVRTSGSYTVEIPFFTATPAGPRHFHRTLTAGLIGELAARHPAPKKKLWPFG